LLSSIDQAKLASAVGRVVVLPAFDDITRYENNPIECDRGRPQARLQLLRGLGTDWTASTVIRGYAFLQNVGRGHDELGVEARREDLRVAAAFDELTASI